MAEEKKKIIGFKRGNGLYKVGYRSVDVFKYYKKNGGIVKNQRLFTRVNRAFWETMIDEMLDNNFEFTFKHRMGTLRIIKRKKQLKLKEGKLDTSNIKPDWKATKLLWMENPKAREQKKLIFHMNEHTEGYWFMFKWDKATACFRNKLAYSFVATRANKKKLVNSIYNGKVDRYEY